MRRIITLLGIAGGAARVAAAPLAFADLAWRAAGGVWALVIIGLAVCWLATRMPMIASAAAASAKAYAVEDRLDLLVPKIPAQRAAPADHYDSTSSPGNSSYGVSNSSYGMGGGTNVTYVNTGVGDGGVAGCQTSGQVGGSSAHYHTMAHKHTSATDLEDVFNTLRNSYSDLVPAVQTLRDSHSNLVTSVQQIQASHADLSNKHNALSAALQSTRLLT